VTPLIFQWDGEAMQPLERFVKLANEQYVVGETYKLEVVGEVSSRSRGHYFAVLHEAFDNLPDHLRAVHGSVEHLRKFALCMTGFHNSQSIVCESQAQAQRVAAMARGLDTYAVVIVEGVTVTILTAKSQRANVMGKAEFQRSKDETLAYVAGMIGVDPATLSKNAGKAA
jgi:hypothetical protein